MGKYSKDIIVLILGIALFFGGLMGIPGQKEAQYTDEGVKLTELLGYKGTVEEFPNYVQRLRDEGAEYLTKHFKTSSVVDAGQRSHEVKDGAKYFNTPLVKRYGYIMSVKGPYVKRVSKMHVGLLVSGSVIIGFQVASLTDSDKNRHLKGVSLKGLSDDFFDTNSDGKFWCPFGCCDDVKGKVKENKLN